MARTADENSESIDKMLLDDGTTTHITPHKYKVVNARSSRQSIKLADYSTVKAKIMTEKSTG